MKNIDLNKLFETMVAAFKSQLQKDWPHIRDYAEPELRKIIQSIGSIEEMNSKNQITAQQARLQLDMQKDAAVAVLLSMQGLTALALQNAFNAAFDAVKDVVNKALGWGLL